MKNPITICISETDISGDFDYEFFTGSDLVEAIQSALRGRGVLHKVTATSVIPLGGTHYHEISRDGDPDAFWKAQLTHDMLDNEDYGWGATEAEARTHATPEIE